MSIAVILTIDFARFITLVYYHNPVHNEMLLLELHKPIDIDVVMKDEPFYHGWAFSHFILFTSMIALNIFIVS